MTVVGVFYFDFFFCSVNASVHGNIGPGILLIKDPQETASNIAYFPVGCFMLERLILANRFRVDNNPTHQDNC